LTDHRTKVAIVFDDGFAKSSRATADVFEQFHLRAVFAVLAKGFDTPQRFPIGDFSLWNELQSRGHRPQPHGYTHANLPNLPHDQAVEQMRLCLELFQQKLTGFDARKTVYHFTYNLSTPALVQWLLPRVAGVRHGGDALLSNDQIASRVWPSCGFGPDDPYEPLLAQLELARQTLPAGLFLTLHGLDNEGWGATNSDNLRRLLEIITTDPALEYWPVP